MEQTALREPDFGLKKGLDREFLDCYTSLPAGGEKTFGRIGAFPIAEHLLNSRSDGRYAFSVFLAELERYA